MSIINFKSIKTTSIANAVLFSAASFSSATILGLVNPLPGDSRLLVLRTSATATARSEPQRNDSETTEVIKFLSQVTEVTQLKRIDKEKQKNEILVAQGVEITREFVPQRVVISKNSNSVELYFVKDALAHFINPQLAQYNGNFLKDTDFNKAGMQNLRFELVREPFDVCGSKVNCILGTGNRPIKGGMRVYGDWYFNHRELIGKNPFTGKKHFTPWIEVRGSAELPIYFEVNNGELSVSSGYPTVQGSNSFGDILSLLVNWVPKIRDNVQEAVNQLKLGKDFKPIVIDQAATYLANQRVIDQNTAKQIISQNLPRIDINVADDKLIRIRIKIPQFQLNLTEGGSSSKPPPPMSRPGEEPFP
jgi:hypothetical protein